MRESKREQKNKGFILFEVLISIAILSVGSLLLAKSLTQSLKTVHASQDYYIALLRAESILWEMDNNRSHSSTVKSGEEEQLRNLVWSVDEETVLQGKLKQMKLNLTWDSWSDKKENMSLSAYYRNREK